MQAQRYPPQTLRLAKLATQQPKLSFAEIDGLIAKGLDSLARERLILAHLPIVIREARRYAHHHPGSIEDLAGAATVAMIEAIDHLDHARSFALTAHVARLARLGAMAEIAERGNLIRVPATVQKVVRMIDEGRELSPIAAKFARYAGLARHAIGAGAVGGDRESTEPNNPKNFADSTTPDDPDDDGLPARLALWATVNRLPPREAEVIHLRYGSDEDEQATYQDVGNQLGIPRRSVAIIERRAFRRLREMLVVGGEIATGDTTDVELSTPYRLIEAARSITASGRTRASARELGEMIGLKRSAVNDALRMIRANPGRYPAWPLEADSRSLAAKRAGASNAASEVAYP